MRIFKKCAAFFFALIMALSLFGCDGSGSPEPPAPAKDTQKEVNDALSTLDDEQFTLAQMNGTDALGRKVSATAGQNEKYVGMFYFVANGYHTNKIYDISKLLEQFPDRTIYTSPITAISTGPTSEYYDPSLSPEELAHYWGEPLYGYYCSEDPWVLRKHLELFAYADIDFLYLDYTNNIIYPEATKALLDAILDMQKEGYDVPQVTFFLSGMDPGGAAYTMASVVSTYFSGSNLKKYESCWFRADETMNPSQKPLLVCNWSNCEEEYKDMFWLKYIQGPGQIFNADAIPWMDWNVYQKNHNGIMNVSVSQGGEASSEAYFNPKADYRARGWKPELGLDHGADDESVLRGDNFDYQWNNVFESETEVNMVTVTGWNEWIVRKLPPDDPASSVSDRGMYVDSFNMAYSRDAEMMAGGYGDNYYMQLVENIRRFKGITVEESDNVALFEQTSIDIDDLSSWDKVSRKYLDLGVSTIARNYQSVDPSLVYEDDTARNDIESLKIANDAQNLYVAVTCKSDIEEYNGKDENWMNLYLSCGGAGWQGYDFIVGRSFHGKKASVQSLSADGKATDKGEANFAVSGNTVVYSIPLNLLGVTSKTTIGVKATDNLQKLCDADEFYTHGDSAPMGRLNYAYKIA